MNPKIICLLLFFIYNAACSQHIINHKWDRPCGGNDNEEFTQILQTNDGGYIIAGVSNSDVTGDKTQNAVTNSLDYWVLKIDSSGVKQWDRRYGSNDDEELLSIAPTSDGGYILTGTTWSVIGWDKTCGPAQIGSSRHGWVVKIDSIGNIMWDECFGASLTTIYEHLNAGQQTSDGGYMFAGYMYPPNVGSTYWMIKTNSLGVQQWDVLYGGSVSEFLTDAKQTPDGGYILGGESDSPVSGNKGIPAFASTDYWVVKTDSLGAKQWEGVYGGTDLDVLTQITLTNDNGYILAGYSSSGVSGNKTQPNWDPSGSSYDYWIVKIDSSGNIEWDKDFGGTSHEYCYSIIQTSDNGYLMSGFSASGIGGDKTENNVYIQEPWIVKIDSMGNKQWEKTIFGRASGKVQAIETGFDEYVIACHAYGNAVGYMTHATHNLSRDFLIIKIGDSTITTSVHSPEINQDIQIVPNPAENKFSISISDGKIAKLDLIDFLGRTIYSTENYRGLPIDCGNYERGIYFVSLSTSDGIFVKKLILE